MSEDGAHVFHKIPVTKEQIVNCSFSSWYPKYKKHVPKAHIIKPLPQSFIDYLSSDGIELPDDGHYAVNVGDGDNEYSDWSSDSDNDEGDESADEEDDGQKVSQGKKNTFEQFKEVHEDIKDYIRQNGPVTPKLNWSAPRDATWILTSNTMKCENASDVYLLLNSSNYITHDLSSGFAGVEEEEENDTKKETELEFELVLRKWFNINPALEFRCFVKNRKIIGVTQRDLNYYDYLDSLSEKIRDLIDDFFEEVLIDSFPDDNYVFDVYLPRPFDRVWLIDINPFARKTDPQLFTWHELAITEVTDDFDYDLRLITETNKGRFAVKEHSENQVPQDVVDASYDPSLMVELAKEWRELQLKQEEKEEEKEEKEEK
ncbi:Cell division cycle protein [Wickerhamomyces ciferrii]|uniref:Cell division cycle protein n=1 Tax=Wickerhamomyces ciferrii (strain ATCC 14091 / BCRC 22168 / CBS 111 / JCM 3599 / NBRC 0793 / NRRL Y-1031 F-60-10) TaxID=1206466 RepID=K0KR55_WICCF|nr:Cell division cycle protein [Wickerhamomyces ciferrii]CCH44582.1 Cell division cycle protein [Wickerhamomyces ciferrii]